MEDELAVEDFNVTELYDANHTARRLADGIFFTISSILSVSSAVIIIIAIVRNAKLQNRAMRLILHWAVAHLCFAIISSAAYLTFTFMDDYNFEWERKLTVLIDLDIVTQYVSLLYILMLGSTTLVHTARYSDREIFNASYIVVAALLIFHIALGLIDNRSGRYFMVVAMVTYLIAAFAYLIRDLRDRFACAMHLNVTRIVLGCWALALVNIFIGLDFGLFTDFMYLVTFFVLIYLCIVDLVMYETVRALLRCNCNFPKANVDASI